MPTTWEIVEMYHNPYDTHSPDDPNALYSYRMKPKNLSWRTDSYLGFYDVQTLMTHFKVTQPSNLIGLEFESQSNVAVVAIGLLLIQVRHIEKNSSISSEKIRQRLLAPLIGLEQPSFSDIDDKSVVSAFLEVWDGQSAQKPWLDKLKGDIKYYSGNQVELLDADPNQFTHQLNGPAEYLILTYQGRSQKLILTPSSTPITFD